MGKPKHTLHKRANQSHTIKVKRKILKILEILLD